MSEITYVVFGHLENGKAVLLKEQDGRLVLHREIKTLIDGEIISEESELIS